MEIKAKKIDDNHILYHDALTNDPVAVARVVKNTYGKGNLYSLSLHPSFRQMYPESNDLVNTNIKHGESAEEAKTLVLNKYHSILNNARRDPMHVTYGGKSTQEVEADGGKHNVTYDQYHLHDTDGKHVVTMNVEQSLSKHIGSANADTFNAYSQKVQHLKTNLVFHGEQPTPEKFAISKKKHPGNDPISMMHQVRHWLDTKDKEPNFVGHYMHDNVKVYRTTLSPEEASNKYMEHLQSKPEYKEHKFTRIAPTLFTAVKQASSEYNRGKHETIDTSSPNRVRHISVDLHHLKSYNTKPLHDVIE